MKTLHCALFAAFAAMLALNAGAQADVPAAAEEAAAVTATAVEETVEAVAEAAAPVAEAAAEAVEEAAEAAPKKLDEAAAAQEYIDAYADNVQEDPDFKANIEAALATVRQERPAYGTFWAVFPPLLAIVLALITKEVYSSLHSGPCSPRCWRSSWP